MSKNVFSLLFANNWQDLPAELQKHYQITRNTSVFLKGNLAVTYQHKWMYLLYLGSLLSGNAIPLPNNNIKLLGHLKPTKHHNIVSFNRSFTTNQPQYFRSDWELVSRGECIEFMGPATSWWRPVLGWHFIAKVEEGKVVLEHKCFVIKWFGKRFKAYGAELFAGKGKVVQEVIDNRISLVMSLTHGLLGTLYQYKATYQITTRRYK